MSDAAHEPIPPEEGEVRHLPVPAAVPEARPVSSPAVGQAGELQRFLGTVPAPVLAAAGGFLMGVFTWVAVRVLRRGSRRAIPGLGRRGRRGVQVAGTRSFLVDVHLLKDR